MVQNEIRDTDSLIRWGGEEFILICPNCNLSDAERLAEKFRSKIEKHVYKNNMKITASFGVTELNEEESFQVQMIRVDENLYKSKETGKNKVISS